MSKLKVNQIKTKLLDMFESHLDLSDLSENDAERRQKTLTRCLAALAIYLESGCTVEEAAGSVWDGADDNGVDAAYYDPSDTRVLFVQAKWLNKGAGEPDAAEVGLFTKGVKDAIELDETAFHARLLPRLKDIFAYLGTPGTSVHIIVATTGASALSKHSVDTLDKLLAELNGNDPEPIASGSTMGLAEVYEGLARDPLRGNVSLDATLLDWSYVATPFPAYFGIIDGLQLKDWSRTHGRGLVSANIRHSLGATEVNSQIRQTALNQPEYFWYFNNGITLVADQAVKAPLGVASRSAGNFTFKGASVVNGAQTVSALGKVDEDEKLALVRVPFRVVLLSAAPGGFGQEVARTNNLQNRIEPRDFVAQDPEQSRLRMEMAMEGVDYQYVRSEDTSISPTSCELIEVTTALACASGDPNLAVQVKTGVSRIFADLRKPPYKALFNPSTNGACAFNTALVLRAIDRWIEERKRTLPKKSGPGWGVLVHGNRILAASVFSFVDPKTLAQPIGGFEAVLSKMELPMLCEAVYASMVNVVQEEYPNRFLAVLFKNPTMSRKLFEQSRSGAGANLTTG